ncbi:MAG: hypothetical protein F4X13_10105 [Gammaproteobacteria bacterium]|nr:hypothetical protein [Gammaproteobacteria bacterium]
MAGHDRRLRAGTGGGHEAGAAPAGAIGAERGRARRLAGRRGGDRSGRGDADGRRPRDARRPLPRYAGPARLRAPGRARSAAARRHIVPGGASRDRPGRSR